MPLQQKLYWIAYLYFLYSLLPITKQSRLDVLNNSKALSLNAAMGLPARFKLVFSRTGHPVIS
jgi:hypothetical protein